MERLSNRCRDGASAPGSAGAGWRLAWCGSWLLSLLLHLLLALLLSMPIFWYPLAASDGLERIIWYYPSLKAASSGGDDAGGGETAEQPQVVAAAQRQSGELPRSGATMPTASAQAGAVPAAAAARQETVAVARPLQESAPPVAEARRRLVAPPEPTAVVEDAAAEEPTAESMTYRAARETAKPVVAALAKPKELQPLKELSAAQPPTRLPVQERISGARQVAAASAATKPLQPPVAVQVKQTPVALSGAAQNAAAGAQPQSDQRPPVARTVVKPVAAAAVLRGEPSREAVAQPEASRSTGSVRSGPAQVVSRTLTGQGQGGAAVKETVVNAQKNDAAPERAGSGKLAGPQVVAVRGDLKIELDGSPEQLAELTVQLGFRDFPRGQRNRPVSRAAAQRVAQVTPKVQRLNENSLHVVMETVAEGIYYLRVLTGRRETADIVLTVKTYEGTARARLKRLGEQQVVNNEVVLKVLMPEGLIWSDDSAFTGNLDDSDSTTKFNAATGLVWKEYKQAMPTWR